MIREEVSQLVILGNGFDLKLKLNTKFEDYMKKFYFDEKKELDDLFENLIKLSSLTVENLENANINEWSINDKVDEIIDYINNIKINSKEKKLVSNFYIKVRCNQLKEKVIPKVESLGKIYSKNSIKYDNRIKLLKGLSEEMLNRYKMNDDTADKSENKRRLNFWDLYFLYLRENDALNDDSNWSNVEYQILKFYKGNDNESAKYDELVKIKDKKLVTIFKNIFKAPINRKVSSDDIDGFLYKELLSFSQNFVNYLKVVYDDEYSKSVDGCNSKQQIRDDLIESIAGLNRLERISSLNRYELLNFNYTNAATSHCAKEIHIHGSLNGKDQPIIGINAEDLTSNKEHAFKLTKQYQLISSKNNKVEKLDLENIDKIIFYGHSLALADYQYFRNIFNRINLAESSVQLVFKYSKGYENYDSIFKLLDRYSKDVGMDIVTTLMLENRLKTEKI